MAPAQRLICASGDLEDSRRGVRFDIAREGGPVPAFVVRFEGRVHAYLNRCAHLPMELDWRPGEFFDAEGLVLICSTHGALYAPESGACIGGRCVGCGGLEPVPVEERDGAVYLKEREHG